MAAADRIGSTRFGAGTLAALVFAALVFVTWPGLDLQVAGWFALGDGRFAGQAGAVEATRRALYWVPSGLLAVLVLLGGLRRFARAPVPAPSLAGLAFLAISFATGPGLLVNTVLKDHWHRPRPYQTRDLGGADAFRPFWRGDGACERNCSFVSGEGSAAFWTLAPALLAPPPLRVAAVAAALLFGTAVSALRIAAGGHYLSDTVFAGLLTWLVIILSWRLVARLAGVNPAA